ncbi:MAG TPA: PKD domain-containing protein [Thermoanaerobaculia bacterium]|nr:PKD domain-containing protein [Thermoanaerobaculia bacterium]
MKSIRAYGLGCVFFLLTVAAHATTIVLPTDEQLIAKAPVIVDGTVLSSSAVERDGRIWTETRLSVARRLKGEAADIITIHELGGIAGERITKIFGTPEFEEGERVLLFLEPNPRGGYRTVDLFIGKFEEAETMDGQRLWLREDVHDVLLLDAQLRPIESGNVQRDATGFESFVHDRVAGRTGARNYGVANPILKTERRAAIKTEFELISEPTLYRWFRFDNGQDAQWYSSGTQAGYSDGGIAEVRTAVSAWTNYTGAKIRYTYAGTRSGSMGGLDGPNGVNEVLLGDPLNEISGSWDPSTGGVVGRGGFNGVSSQQNWTAPFTADANHTAGVKRVWNITEGNLVIQDNVSPGKGISSSRLAEIISHEFGHTLGFGHSADSTALMYATVTGRGPALKEDDQLAARWLYPNGTGTTPTPTPTTPAAPSNLQADASGSNIDLLWNDNANNESGFAIFVNGSEVTRVGPNTLSARLSGLGAGTYNIYVLAYNGSGNSAGSNTVSVTISLAGPTAKFSFTPQSGTSGVTTFTFYDESTGTVSSRTFSFGDGQSSTAKVATHVYKSPGTYTVTLTVNGNGKTSTATQKVTVSAPLAASFVYSPSAPTVNDTIIFSDQSAGAPVEWLWKFGDNTTSTAQNPAKKYDAPGNYTVTLTISRDGVSATGARVVTVTSGSGGPPVTPAVTAAFDASTSSPNVGASVSFTDRSSGAPTRWSWSFGDGNTSSAQNPTHTYAAPGQYTVTLTASNATSSSTATKQLTASNASAYRTLVSVAAQTPGVNGTSWRTELSVFNAGAQGANVSLLFLPSNGGSVMSRTLFLAPRQSITYANALLDLFNMATGAGALAIEATSAGTGADLRVTSRTFTTGFGGTYGQAVPDVHPEDLERTLYVTGIAASAAFRTNIGLVNRGGSDVSTQLTLYNETGSVLASKSVVIPANSFQQSPLSAYFPAVDGGAYDVLTMRLSAASQDAVSAYASVVDNKTQDPIYIQAIPSATGGSLTIPVVGRAPGANGTFWRSDVTLFNPSSTAVALSLRYNGSAKTLLLGGGDTQVLADIVAQYGHSSGSGTLQVSWSSATGPVVTSRTYTTANGGTYGQSIDPVPAFATRMFVPGLRNDAEYRSNVGFVNGGSEQEVVAVTLLSPSGTELARKNVTLSAGQQVQYGVTALFDGVSIPSGFTLVAEGDANARVFAYGSMVDNASGDPVFFAGR